MANQMPVRSPQTGSAGKETEEGGGLMGVAKLEWEMLFLHNVMGALSGFRAGNKSCRPVRSHLSGSLWQSKNFLQVIRQASFCILERRLFSPPPPLKSPVCPR
ncbi:Hypothetical predicted protein [Podarcis lilfordi]|uniref:Uncharacterized protein n=1 Tax=Podarcis lilfordi TaxID=74358 RepID=A0AA35JRF3_9SAUR|nr:Hypothetical predicted protein [Podarcis lilfordi]